MDEQYDEFKNGLTVGEYRDGKVAAKYTYSKIAPIVEGRTYAVRSVAYGPSGTPPLEKDKDIIVVFRLLDADGDDGAVTILWKELRRTEGHQMDPVNTDGTD